MAARTGIGIGLGATVGLLGTATLGLFVLTFVFLGQKQNALKDFNELKEQTKQIASESERNNEDTRKLIAEAQAAKKSLVAYVQEQVGVLGQKITGASGKNPATLVADLDAALKDSGQTSVLGLLTEQRGKLAAAEKAARDADAARQAALQDLQGQAALTKKQKEDLDKALAAMTKDVGAYKGDVDKFGADLNKARADMAATIERVKREAEDKEAELNNRLTKANEELAVARGIISRFQKDRSKDSLRPADEYALVDGEVITLDPARSDTVFINRGRKHKVVLGMTFEVYASAQALRPVNEGGDYPRGKATIEIIRIDDESSSARVIRTTRGNPIAKGDVIANAIYDPNKTYTFVVFGNFDYNGDNQDTSAEATDIRALIENWGGKVTDSLTGDVDFLVLGSRPVAPPAPPTDAPAAVLDAYIKQRRAVQDYDKLLEQASATSIPVLSQNRLFTLTGFDARR
jgi:hypothetical protein